MPLLLATAAFATLITLASAGSFLEHKHHCDQAYPADRAAALECLHAKEKRHA